MESTLTRETTISSEPSRRIVPDMRETLRARGEGILMDTLKPSIHGYYIFDGPRSLTLAVYRLRLVFLPPPQGAPDSSGPEAAFHSGHNL